MALPSITERWIMSQLNARKECKHPSGVHAYPRIVNGETMGYIVKNKLGFGQMFARTELVKASRFAAELAFKDGR